jgi:hypothetical protein
MNNILEGSSTTERFWSTAIEYKQTFIQLANILVILLMACIPLALFSLWEGDYRALSVYLAIGTISFYFSKRFLSRSDGDWREISTKRRYLNKEINTDDYKWVVDCCNKHSELKIFVKKISSDEKLKEKELRLFWLELCKIEAELEQSKDREDFLEIKNLLSETIETE